jgi:hypothetical protein
MQTQFKSANRKGGYDKLDILHHIGVINKNLHALSKTYEKLGFILTPLSTPQIVVTPGEKPAALGVGNRHAIFNNNYLELLGIVDPDRWSKIPKVNLGPYNIDTALERYEGLHVMHFGTDHIESVKERFDQEEIPCSEINNFQRNVQTVNGERTMRARTIAFPPRMNPEGLIQVAQHDTPELIFHKTSMAHPNGAVGLTELILCCEQPQEYIRKYERLSGHRGLKISVDHYELDLGHSKIIVLTPNKFRDIVPGSVPQILPFMAAFTVVSNDLNVTRQHLDSNGIVYSTYKEWLIAGTMAAGGCSVIFKNI